MELLSDTAVIVLHYGDAARTLGSLRRARALYPNPSAPRLYLVENAPLGVREGALPGVARLPLKENAGYGGGNNCGVQRALADGATFVVLLNNDVEVVLGIFEVMRRAAADQNVGLVGTRLREQAGSVYGGGRVSWWGPRTLLARTPLPAEQLTYLHGACLGVTRACIDRVGLLDASLFLYWEDVDYSLRARRAGLRFAVVSDPVLPHDDSATLRQHPPVKTYYLVRNALHTLEAHGPFWARQWAAVTVPLRYGRAVARGQTAVTRGLADARRGVRGPLAMDPATLR